jgi:hypothetical protein
LASRGPNALHVLLALGRCKVVHGVANGRG